MPELLHLTGSRALDLVEMTGRPPLKLGEEAGKSVETQMCV